MPTPLTQLASYAGVSTSYEDAFGEWQAAPEGSLRTILAGLGFEAASEADATTSLADARAREWERTLAPVYVVPADTEPELSFSVGTDAALRTLHWSIAGEDGRTWEGTAVPSELTVVEDGICSGRTYARYALAPRVRLAAGYYRLAMRDGPDTSRATIAAVPSSCYLPDTGRGRGMWGLAAQLYSLCSPRNWGIGDFTDLAALATTVRTAGGDAVGINPLHQLQFRRGVAPSPYAPSSRNFLNWIYLDVEALPGFEPSDVAASDVVSLREPEFVDYDAVARTKRRVARAAYERFEPHASEAFRAFVREGGEALRFATTFEVLAERFSAELPAGEGWQYWPEAYRDPASAAVREYLCTRERDVEFCAYLQWQADVQLGAAATAARELGVGLYRDLAVGAELGGADTWALQSVLKSDVSVGAPPDILNRRGQDWGVAPFDPLALRGAAYEPFIALLRANMRHAGALRIDHVMALTRLWWIPEKAEAPDGAYVTYPVDELIGIIALESRRARCMVIGEDLGTVPGGLRERLSAAHILSYRLLQFETDDERFFAPDAYPALALMCTGTHDLPFVGAYWTAHDVDVRRRLGLLADNDAAEREGVERAKKRAQLLEAWSTIGLSQSDASRFAAAASHPEDRSTLAEIALWANRYLAQAPGLLLMVQLEDLAGEIEQVNVPGTTTEHPNWRRRFAIDFDARVPDARVARVARMLAERRPGTSRAWEERP